MKAGANLPAVWAALATDRGLDAVPSRPLRAGVRYFWLEAIYAGRWQPSVAGGSATSPDLSVPASARLTAWSG